jgi:hypothetical protein
MIIGRPTGTAEERNKARLAKWKSMMPLFDEAKYGDDPSELRVDRAGEVLYHQWQG